MIDIRQKKRLYHNKYINVTKIASITLFSYYYRLNTICTNSYNIDHHNSILD
jgi:hypothetical protein